MIFVDTGAWFAATDCVSRVVMTRLGIQMAFAFDDHFRQFGTVTVMVTQHFDNLDKV